MLLKFSGPYFLCVNVDMWMTCVVIYLEDISGSYLADIDMWMIYRVFRN